MGCRAVTGRRRRRDALSARPDPSQTIPDLLSLSSCRDGTHAIASYHVRHEHGQPRPSPPSSRPTDPPPLIRLQSWNYDPTGICLVFPSLQITSNVSLFFAVGFRPSNPFLSQPTSPVLIPKLRAVLALSLGFEGLRTYINASERNARALARYQASSSSRPRSPGQGGIEDGLLGRRGMYVSLPVHRVTNGTNDTRVDVRMYRGMLRRGRVSYTSFKSLSPYIPIHLLARTTVLTVFAPQFYLMLIVMSKLIHERSTLELF